MKKSFKITIGAIIIAIVLFIFCGDNSNNNPTGGNDTPTTTQYTLTITTRPANGGSVARNPNQTSYTNGTQIFLTATANEGFVFAGWTGDLTSASREFTFNITRNTILMANFEEQIENPCIEGVDCNDDMGYCDDDCTLVERQTCFGSFSQTQSAVCQIVDPNTVVIGTMTDSRDNQMYRTVTIGTQTWLAENLNFDTNSGSLCYNNVADSCAKYGRLYDWATAMNIDSLYNNSLWNSNAVNHQGICPTGWHLPSATEWDALFNAVGGGQIAGTKLKSSIGWTDQGIYAPVSTDEYGFSALPGGEGWSNSNGFSRIGLEGNWWSTTSSSSTMAWGRRIRYNEESITWLSGFKTNRFSVRCVRD